jgi:glycosyltransferase involved in cell wall biosynthesis
VDTHVSVMTDQIRREVASKRYDVVIASEMDTAGYWEAWHGVPSILEDLESSIFASAKAAATTSLQRLRYELTELKLRRYLRRILPRFSACTVVSDVEAEHLQRWAPGGAEIEIIPNGISLDTGREIARAPEPETLIFTGSFRYGANHEAMIWFLREIYPRIQKQLPGVRMVITGDHANLPLPPSRNVTLTGYVDDVQSLIASSWASVVPMRYGTGTRLKILEAMALRTPVIATSKGAEGLAVENDRHILIADDPQAFAEAVVRVCTEAGLRQRLTKAAYQLVREKYDWSVVMPRFLDLVDRVASAEGARVSS